jgi:hypothetical protein
VLAHFPAFAVHHGRRGAIVEPGSGEVVRAVVEAQVAAAVALLAEKHDLRSGLHRHDRGDGGNGRTYPIDFLHKISSWRRMSHLGHERAGAFRR